MNSVSLASGRYIGKCPTNMFARQRCVDCGAERWVKYFVKAQRFESMLCQKCEGKRRRKVENNI